MIRGLNTTLFQVQKMKVTANVSLLDSKGSEPAWYNTFRSSIGNYLSLNTNASLKIKYLKDKLLEGYGNNDWSQQDQLYITYKNIGGFKMDLRSFYHRFQRPDLFRYDENDIPISINSGNRDIVISRFETGQICSFEPAIVVTQDDKIYPGVLMRINIKAHEVKMTVSEFESFYDIIQNIKLHDVGMHMIQTYLLMTRNGFKEPEKVKPPSAYILFEQKEEKQEEELTTNTPMIKTPTTLDDLGG